MTALLRYDAACKALAEAKAVDEVKDVRDKAEAMRQYGRIAQNKDLEVDATEIRIRAERRLGELIAAQKGSVGLNRGTAGAGDRNVGRATGGRDARPPVDDRPTLAAAGISKDLSSRAQKIAAVPAKEFEEQVGEWRDRVQQEGERVTANLVQSGEKHQRKAAVPAARGSADDRDEVIAELREKVEVLSDDLKAYLAVEEGEGIAEIKRLQAEVRRLTLDRDRQQSTCTQLKRQNASLERQVAKLERQLKGRAA